MESHGISNVNKSTNPACLKRGICKLGCRERGIKYSREIERGIICSIIIKGEQL